MSIWHCIKLSTVKILLFTDVLIRVWISWTTLIQYLSAVVHSSFDNDPIFLSNLIAGAERSFLFKRTENRAQITPASQKKSHGTNQKTRFLQVVTTIFKHRSRWKINKAHCAASLKSYFNIEILVNAPV